MPSSCRRSWRFIFPRPLVTKYPESIEHHFEDDVQLKCASCWFAGEANNLNPWKAIPEQRLLSQKKGTTLIVKFLKQICRYFLQIVVGMLAGELFEVQVSGGSKSLVSQKVN